VPRRLAERAGQLARAARRRPLQRAQHVRQVPPRRRDEVAQGGVEGGERDPVVLKDRFMRGLGVKGARR